MHNISVASNPNPVKPEAARVDYLTYRPGRQGTSRQPKVGAVEIREITDIYITIRIYTM